MSRTPIPAGAVVVGVDGSPDSDRALAWATHQAHVEQRPLAVVHAVGPGEVWREVYGLDHEVLQKAVEADAIAIVDQATRRAREQFPDLEVYDEVPFADPRVALLELSRHAAMVVLGSRGRGPVSRLLLGSVSIAVSQHASCPVVVIRPQDPDHEHTGILVGIDDTERARPALEFAYRLAALGAKPLTVLHCFFDGRPFGPVPADEPGLEADRLMLSETVAGLSEDHPDVEVTLALARGLADECLVRASDSMELVVVAAHPTHPLLGLLTPNVDRLVVAHAPCAVAVVPAAPAASDEPAA